MTRRRRPGVPARVHTTAVVPALMVALAPTLAAAQPGGSGTPPGMPSPARIARSEPSVGGSMVMRYSDYDRPAAIDLPPCLGS
ncbi:MAG TPA: hypothetical protein VIE44_06755 [Methylomirabilota bacterium]|jgi:hypothetical protein